MRRVFEDFRYLREIGGDAGHALVFEATINGKQLTGCDFLRYDEAGRITELMVMVRPLSAANELAKEMAVQFGRIQQEGMEQVDREAGAG